MRSATSRCTRIDDGLKVFRIVEQAQQNVGSDVVRKIADDLRRFGTEFDAGPAQAGLGSEQGIEIDGENVGLDDFDIGEHAEAQAKLCGQHAVEFHGDQAAGALGQQGSENAASGADFEHGVLRNVAEGVDDLRGISCRWRENAVPTWAYVEDGAWTRPSAR